MKRLDRGDGVELAAIHTPGRSPTLVFLPGFASDMTGEKATTLTAHAAALGHATLRLDYSGHGASGGQFIAGTIGRWTQDVLFLIDHLTTGPLILAGSSMGGWIALLATLARPTRVAALLGIAAAPDFTEDLIWTSLSPADRAALHRDGLLRTPGAYGTEQIITLALLEEGRRHRLLGSTIPITCPVRLVQGMRDQDVPWQTALRLAEALAGEDVRTVLLKDGEHRLSRAQDLAVLREATGALLAEIADPKP